MTHLKSITPIVKFNTTMLNSSLFNYSDTSALVKGIITITGDRENGAARQEDKRNIQVTFKNCAPFIGLVTAVTA